MKKLIKWFERFDEKVEKGEWIEKAFVLFFSIMGIMAIVAVFWGATFHLLNAIICFAMVWAICDNSKK